MGQFAPMTTLALERRKSWRPTPFLWFSLALHASALLALVVQPSAWPWVVAVLVVNHAAITACGLIPRNAWLGENLRRLPAASAARGEWALTIDDGPDPEVTPRVLDLLDTHGVKATFFCIASRAREHPQLIARIVAAGHSVQNHSDVHAHSFSLWGPARIEQELTRAQSTLARFGGREPRFFRAPAGLHNPLLAPVLHRMNLHLVSWTRRGYDTRVREPARVLARLLPALERGAILLVHDGHAARDVDSGEPVVLHVLPRLLEAAHNKGLRGVTLPQAFDER
jgi:peptidoglycan-N-acetylglucosamine deacetylase